MIKIQNQPFRGVGVGNKFFMYTYVRLLSEKLGYALKSDEVVCCENISDKYTIKFDDIIGFDYSLEGEIFGIDDGFGIKHQTIDNAVEFLQGKKLNIISSGYFQKYSYWKNYKDDVKLYFDKFTSKDFYDDDKIALHLRSCPLDPRFALPDEYYLLALEKMGNKEIHVYYDYLHMHEKFLKKIEHLNPIIKNMEPFETMKEITRYKNIICSNGSFSFWGSFLSNANKVICPIESIFPNEHSENSSIDYFIDDDDRYEYIKIKNL
jgi:hypothetical protein